MHSAWVTLGWSINHGKSNRNVSLYQRIGSGEIFEQANARGRVCMRKYLRLKKCELCTTIHHK
jgi:hypothetical protein